LIPRQLTTYRFRVPASAFRETMIVFGVGLAAGIVAAVVAVRLTAHFISDLLFGLTATDVPNMMRAVLLMVVVALAACVLPAWRATRIDPLTAIRHEQSTRSARRAATLADRRIYLDAPDTTSGGGGIGLVGGGLGDGSGPGTGGAGGFGSDSGPGSGG